MRTLRDASLLAEHQLSAVERLESLLEKYGGAILADEPGLGKSFVAAEIARREVRHGGSVEAIVPASLVAQWVETFGCFGVNARVMTHAALLTEDHHSMDGARLIVVDEAHAFRNRETQRFEALARRSVGARLLLVTATPVCNSALDLESLLRLIVSDDALMTRGVPSIDIAFANGDRDALDVIVSELVIRRDRSVLPLQLAFGDLDRRVIWTGGATEETEALIAALRFPLVAGAPLVRDFLTRRLESSAAAVLESLRRQRRFYERVLECLATGRALPKREYRRAFAHEQDAPAFQTILFWEMFVEDTKSVDPQEINDAIELIDRLRDVVLKLPPEKERMLVDLCMATKEPILIFTGWTATALSLGQALGKIRRTVVVTGRERSNDASIDRFRCGAADILVSTDVGAEGLNLQRAGVVVHYDLPWNPTKIDQRNGRAHRIGQRRDSVRAIYFLPDRHRGRVFRTVANKNRTRRQLLRSSTLDPQRQATTIRPRVAADAAAARLTAGHAVRPSDLPAILQRRHRAGIEFLIGDLSRGTVTETRLRELAAVVAREPWAPSPGISFRPL